MVNVEGLHRSMLRWKNLVTGQIPFERGANLLLDLLESGVKRAIVIRKNKCVMENVHCTRPLNHIQTLGVVVAASG